jgi:tRNA-splicing ligase RtcB
MKTIITERIPIKMWLEEIEDGALVQAENLANFPFSFSHIAIMPDAHEGYGMPIGGVLATEKVIIPNAVGVDIGCGMCAVKTSAENISRKELLKIVDQLKKAVPVGSNHHKEQQKSDLMPEMSGTMKIVEEEYENALFQIGTLGGGNHFIEVQKGNDGFVWLMIHSGSRNIGYKVAGHYNQLAIELRDEFKSEIPLSWQLDYFPLESVEGKNYVNEMNFCVSFAFANRLLMMERFKNIFLDECSGKNLSFEPVINIAHNYAAFENHFGKAVTVHRKGATSAKAGEKGIIPGSQGAKSYIVEGLGNPESFKSCSHGAGRKMGRREAIRKLNLDEEIQKLNKIGVVHSIRNQNDLEEAAGAYKDICEVMSNQKDLVKIIVELSPLAVMKG